MISGDLEGTGNIANQYEMIEQEEYREDPDGKLFLSAHVEDNLYANVNSTKDINPVTLGSLDSQKAKDFNSNQILNKPLIQQSEGSNSRN